MKLRPEEREIFLELRREIPKKEKKTLQIIEYLLESKSVQEAKAIAFFAASREEVDLFALFEHLQKEGKICLFPKIIPGQRGVMEMIPVSNKAELQPGMHNILEPQAGTPFPPEQIDLILTTALSIDQKGNRIGYGGGYYDRYFARAPEAKKIAVLFHTQWQQNISFTPGSHDIPMDGLCTEEGIFYFSGDKCLNLRNDASRLTSKKRSARIQTLF